MKKLLVVLLTLALCVTSLASCDFLNNLFGEKEPEVVYDVDAAANYIYNLYKNKEKTAVDFQVTAKVNIAGVMHDVEWSVNTDKVKIEKLDENNYLVNVDEKSPEEVQYVLTATIKGGNKTATKSFNLIVPLYGLVSWEDYIAAEAGEIIPEVRGVVTGIVSKSVGASYNCLFLQDATGGAYYIYGMQDNADPIADLGIEIGMTVSVAGGIKDIYSGTHEIKPNEGALQVTILSSEKTPVAPMDYTEIYKNAADLKADALLEKQSSLVTIKGVEITDQALENGYLKFKLGDKESYLRISGSTLAFPTANKDAFIAEHAAKKGYTADVTGIISQYNGSFYLVPVDTNAFVYGQALEKTPAEKVESALGGLKVLGAIYNKDAVVTLPSADTTYTDVVFAWESNNAAAVVADGKLTITIPAEDTEITIKVTATCGEATDSKEFKVKLTNFPDANTFINLVQANKIGVLMNGSYTEGKYFVTGEIVSIDPDKDDNTKLNKYGNMTIKDKDGNTFYLYGLYTPGKDVRFDKMDPQPKVGDTITVYGIIGSYKGAAQMKDGWLVTVPAADSELSVPAANTIGLAQGHDKYTEGKYSITGEITEIASTKYGNMTIKDEKGNTLYLYGLYSADGATRYDAMEVKPAVGDTITVYGIVGQYKGTAQVKNGWMTKHTAGTTEEGGDNTDTPSTPATGAKDTIGVTAVGGTLAADKLTITWATDNFTVISHKNASNDIRTSDEDHFRCYANSKFEVVGKTNKTIAKLVITCTSASYAEVLVTSATNAGYKATANDKVVTIEINAAKVEYTHSAQVRINNIEIYY